MNREEAISTLKAYFQDKADAYDIDAAFLYGSWACGYPKIESDVDVAVLFNHEMSEEKIFSSMNTISLELTDILKREVNVLYIDKDLSRPMLHYNAIVKGMPVFMRDFTRYVDLRLKAISQMEDFNVFGTKWQSDVVRKRLEGLDRARV
ncbi:MAG: nucleotidyltransferase domain-containing protein [Deltaproteobacteria bacterium]